MNLQINASRTYYQHREQFDTIKLSKEAVMKNKKGFNVLVWLGVVIVLLGLAFLADLIFELNLFTKYWPVGLVLLGLPLILAVIGNRTAVAILAVPGSLLITLGLILLMQNMLDLWTSWAYIWTLLISALGLGLLILGCAIRQRALYPWAGVLIGLGLLLFLILGGVFEYIFHISQNKAGVNILLAGALILFGIYLIFLRSFFKPRRKPMPVVPEVPPVEASVEQVEAEIIEPVEEALEDVEEHLEEQAFEPEPFEAEADQIETDSQEALQ